MKTLIYVPIVHTYEEMAGPKHPTMWESLYPAEAVKKVKDDIRSVVNGYWDMAEKEVKEKAGSLRGVMIFHDSYFFGEEEADKYLGRMKEKWPESRSDDFVRKARQEGARVARTEDLNILKKWWEGCYDEDVLDRERDMFVARMVNEQLKDGGVAILFMGTAHDPLRYLGKDITIKRVEPFDADKRIDDILNECVGKGD